LPFFGFLNPVPVCTKAYFIWFLNSKKNETPILLPLFTDSGSLIETGILLKLADGFPGGKLFSTHAELCLPQSAADFCLKKGSVSGTDR
jgi:hypothetical protein